MPLTTETEKLKEDLGRLSREYEDVQKQINELQRKKYRLKKEKEEAKTKMEQSMYYGLTQGEYFRKIRGTEFTEGNVLIVIGGYTGEGVFVRVTEDDTEMWVAGDFNVHTDALEVMRNETAGRKGYKTRYLSSKLPKARKDIYEKLMGIKIKYSKMMENGEIEPPMCVE